MRDYTFLSGDTENLEALTRDDLAFLFDLAQRAFRDAEGFTDLRLLLAGAGAYPLKGGPMVTKEIHTSLLYRVADDIVYRAGIRQGAVAPNKGDVDALPAAIMSVGEAARELGITRSAVVKALGSGRLKGRKLGGVWVIASKDVAAYEVAEHRVEAGKLRGQKSGDGEVGELIDKLKKAAAGGRVDSGELRKKLFEAIGLEGDEPSRKPRRKEGQE